MKNVVRSMMRFSWVAPLFGIQQVGNLMSRDSSGNPGGKAATALDSVTEVIEDQLHGTAKGLYKGGDKLQNVVLDRVVGRESAPPPAPEASQEAKATAPAPAKAEEPDVFLQPKVDSGKLDVTTFVLLGDGLAAGMGDFGLSEEYQREGLGARLAWQMRSEFRQPLIEAPGIGDVPGFAKLPVAFPALMQTTGLVDFPPTRPYSNLSIPGFCLADAATLRPKAPLVHSDDAKQTLANLVLGLPGLIDGSETVFPTQVEAAIGQKPTFVLVALGYQDVLEAAVNVDPKLLPEIDTFRVNYSQILESIVKTGSDAVVVTIPDPLDTACLSSVESAARVTKVEPAVLGKMFGLKSDDRVTVRALVQMGCDLLANTVSKPAAGSVLSGEAARRISQGVAAMNDAIRELAAANRVRVFDLAGVFAGVRKNGLQAGKRKLTADFLGGFYTLNGCFPGPTGHAFIANEILSFLNGAFGAAFPLVDLDAVSSSDPVTLYRVPGGPELTMKNIPAPTPRAAAPAKAAAAKSAPVAKGGPLKKAGSGAHGHAAAKRLKLPPGREQIISINKEASFFGDALRASNCRNEKEALYGSGRELLFGGLCLTDSHISGDIRIRFSEPVDDVSHFEVSHLEGLVGDDGWLTAPLFYRLPVLQNRVADDANLVSSGDLNLATGEVTNLSWACKFGNTALLALVRVNPKIPDIPIQFPGMYGSAFAKFEQREDGKLDFSFSGTTFLPLGAALDGDFVKFPLPFAGPTLEFAYVPAAGTSLHPHLHLSTKEPEGPEDPSAVPDLPTNTIREYTLYTHNTAFGDKFTLNCVELEGEPTGRSQLMGRLLVQFGERFGNSISVAMSHINPAGMLHPRSHIPLDDDFPGRLPPSPIGHNEFLRFASQTYFLKGLACIDDPFDLSVNAVSTRTGRFLSEVLHRALIGQNLFYALIRLEPRTPKSSFYFRGPALFEKGPAGETIFRYRGLVTVLYPQWYYFPQPDLATTFLVTEPSVLDPFLWVQAMDAPKPSADVVATGSASKTLSSIYEPFSYSYSIPADPSKSAASFEYTNHAQDGTFRLKSLSSVSFTASRGSKAPAGSWDTVTFSGYGSWSRDVKKRLHMVTAQFATADPSYISIQIDGGDTSNVNTKPVQIDEVEP